MRWSIISEVNLPKGGSNEPPLEGASEPPPWVQMNPRFDAPTQKNAPIMGAKV